MELSQRTRRLIQGLRTRRSRERERLVLVEGVRAVAAALDAGVTVQAALISPRLGRTEGGRALVGRLRGGDGRVMEVDDAVLGSVSDTEATQGVLLVCGEPDEDRELVRAGGRYLLLDGVQDPGNCGTLVRAAAAFGLDGVLFLEGSADPWGSKAVRASAGLVFRVPILRCSVPLAVERLVGQAIPILVADAWGEPVAAIEVPRAFALAVGNEGVGVRSEIRAAAPVAVSIPMPGPAESLNVGMAGSILLYALTSTP